MQSITVKDNAMPHSFRDLPTTENASEVKLTPKLYEYCKDQRISFEEYLEHINPTSDKHEIKSALERQLARFGIFTQDVPEKGIWASPISKFFVTDDSAVLFPATIFKIARMEPLYARTTPYNPNFIAPSRRSQQQNSFTVMYIDDSAAKYHTHQIAEKAAVPTFEIGWYERTGAMKKFGVGITWSYEFQRRATIPMLRRVFDRVRQVREVDVFMDLLDLVQNGDGTTLSPAATSEAHTTYDGTAAASTLTKTSWLYWLHGFLPYQPTHVFCRKAIALQALELTTTNVNTNLHLHPVEGFGGLINSVVGFGGGVTLVVIADADIAADTLVGIDNRNGVERYYEVGGELEETEKIIKNQTHRWQLTYYEGSAKIFRSAMKVMTLS